MFSRVARYYHTLRYLQWIQIKYRLLQPWKRRRAKLRPLASTPTVRPDFHLLPSIPASNIWQGGQTFEFLNLQHSFKDSIDWNYAAYGKLWTYNLTYFEYLSQTDLPPADGLQLIRDFIRQSETIRDGLEPFPILSD